jgi:hypothetical protein
VVKHNTSGGVACVRVSLTAVSSDKKIVETFLFFHVTNIGVTVIIMIIVQENALLETLESTMEPSWSHQIQFGMNWYCSFFLPQHKPTPVQTI